MGTTAGPLIRPATEDDLAAIAAIAAATGQDEEDFEIAFPAYIRHLIAHGTFLVAVRSQSVTGYGGTLQVGSASMLTDLFVHPAAHGSGIGRAILSDLWPDQHRRMTFSSLHNHAVPLYTSFGMDAWWPLLYLDGDPRRLRMPDGWSVGPAEAEAVASLESAWTGVDRGADHRFWAAWPNGSGVIARRAGRPLAAGTVGGTGAEFGIRHLATDIADVDDATGRDAVIAVLSWLDPPDGLARVHLPAPHPATRPLLAAGWRISDLDLHMASEFGLLDARRAVPSPALA